MTPLFSAFSLWAALFGCSETSFYDIRLKPIDQTYVVEGVKTDIVFYGDTSSSMQRELVQLGSQVSSFVSRLDSAQNDWQIMAVTGPGGCANGGIFTPQTPDFAAQFGQAIQMTPEEDDVDEWGLFNVFKAMLKTSPGSCNEGFIREDATLHVIFLSDEDDNSPGFEIGGDYWKDYVDPILYMKDDFDMVKFSAIAGPVPGGCAGADPGLGYVDAVNATGGEFISICDEWEAQVELLADASVQQDFFPLQYVPLDDTLQVFVNDEERLEGWAYDEARQGVEFSDNVPRAYDTVELLYRANVEVEVDAEGNELE